MNIVQIEDSVKHLVKNVLDGTASQKDFIYDFLLSYGHRSQSIGRVRNGERNLAEDKENSVFWKRQLYFKISKQHDLHGLIDQMRKEKRTESSKIRFLIATDFKTLLAVDTKTQDTLDISFGDLAKKFDFFLPWAGMDKAVYQGENPADVKAAEKLAKLFDEIKADNFGEDDLNNKEDLHQLNIFLSRLLFCYFAEDTEIFKDKQFTSAISKSNEDGSDLSSLIGRLFKVLNQSPEDREPDLPDYLADFPYVNGGLFKDDIQVPKFTRKSRRILIECGKDLNWSDINPDIFGSMFQAVVHTEQRSIMGQHYTSVPNIMKVIEPLFLNDLYEELEKNQDNINKLLKLQQRLGQMMIFDPACGSGNFLIIAYKELRKFEMELLKRIQELELEKTGQFSKPFSVIQVFQFYGIELDDFAHEVAILSLWLTEHQMNLVFKDEFGELIPSLPLKQSGNIICENATRVNWSELIHSDNELYILGNPPYIGTRNQNSEQKKDIDIVFKGFSKRRKLDYISIWFYKAKLLIKNKNSKVAFVTTDSLIQGEQVSIFWPLILDKNIEIGFAYNSFKWTNNARNNAGVSVVIIGLRNTINDKNELYSSGVKRIVNHITPYLTEGETLYIEGRKKSISSLPEMLRGNYTGCCNALVLNHDERVNLVNNDQCAEKFIKKYVGANELLSNVHRYCLWISDEDLNDAQEIEGIKSRIEQVRIERTNSKDEGQRKLVNKAHQFREFKETINTSLVIPIVSSEAREYLPCGFIDNTVIVPNSAQIVYESPAWLFSLISSKMHMLWIKYLSGKLESRIRYSSSICYNTFPIPKLSVKDKERMELSTFTILSVRENYPDKTLAELYDPLNMPEDLRQAHEKNDLIIENIYRKEPFLSNEEKIEYLFSLYKKILSNSGAE